MEKIFVIIPCYNCEKTIVRCLDSVIKQTYENLEIICVNDGSTDNTNKLIADYNDKRIHLINKNNGGVSSARNIGLDFVFSNYQDGLISFVDADDFLDLDYFQTLSETLKKYNVDICCCSFNYETKTLSYPCKAKIDIGLFSSFEATNLLVKDSTLQSHSHCKLFKLNVWNGIRFPEGIIMMEDQATLFKVFYNSNNGIYIIDYYGYHYWQEGSSACRSRMTNKKVLDSIFGYLESYKFSFAKYSANQQNLVKQSSVDALSRVYLMMLPRFSSKNATQAEKKTLKEYKTFISSNKIINQSKPSSRKEKIKKRVYLIMRPFYKLIYNLFS